MSKNIVSKKLHKKARQAVEKDSAYVLKLVMYLVFGSFWVHVSFSDRLLPIPIGFLIGLFFVSHDHFKIDRKVEYAVLLVAMFITYFLAPRVFIAL